MANTYDCYKCNGTGEVSFKHIANGVCFQCGGSGKLNFSKVPGHSVTPKFPVIPEGERATNKQWAYFEKLVARDDDACRILKEAGSPCANQLYTTKAVMSRAIEIAKGLGA